MTAGPIPVTDWSREFACGAAEWLAGLGIVTFSETDPIPPDAPAPGLHLDGLPAEPAVACALTVYPVDDDPELSDVVVGLQFTSRGAAEDRFGPVSLDDAIYDALEGARGLTWRGIPVVVVARRSGTSLGQDSNRRWEQVSTYWATSARPSTHRVD